MKPGQDGRWWLRRELVRRLLPALVAIVAISAAAGAHVWYEATDGVGDADDLLAIAILLLLPLGAALVVSLAVRNTIRRVEALADGWRAHAAASLDPVDLTGVPGELLPFAHALNDQISRTALLVRQERQFCDNASHQLRTPLAALELGLARAAAGKDLDSTRAAIADLSQATRRTSRLVEQLLLLARVDVMGGLPKEHERTDLRTLASDVGRRYLQAAAAAGIELELALPDRAVIVEAQPDLLGEALANLIDNALRYTPAPGHVQVEVLVDPPGLRVVDSGPGIPADRRDKLFDRFVRGQAGGTGSGLGLAIARDIARLHGGDLSIAEAKSSAGTEVRMTLPADLPPPVAAAQPA